MLQPTFEKRIKNEHCTPEKKLISRREVLLTVLGSFAIGVAPLDGISENIEGLFDSNQENKTPFPYDETNLPPRDSDEFMTLISGK